MNFRLRLAVGVVSLLALPAFEANAQYNYPYGRGYGGGGFGGFGGGYGGGLGGSTAYGDIARGMGAFAAGEGTYNYDTAVANNINTQTFMDYNNYWYQSQQLVNKREREIMARRRGLVNATEKKAREIEAQVRDNPTEADIESGAAMNALLHQVSDPKILNGSALRLANGKLGAKTIRQIPFRDATDAITISLAQLTDEKSWPFVLRDSKFDKERKDYTDAVQKALDQDKDGDLTPDTVRQVRSTIKALYERVAQTIPKTKQPDHLDAMNYLKGLAGFSRMLEKPNIEAVLGELEKIDTTTAGNLIAFMHTYNLQFGAASTPGEKAAYQQLYPVLLATRDKLIGQPVAKNDGNDDKKAPSPDPAPGQVAPTSIFHGMNAEDLHGSPPPAALGQPAPAGATSTKPGPSTAGSPRP